MAGEAFVEDPGAVCAGWYPPPRRDRPHERAMKRQRRAGGFVRRRPGHHPIPTTLCPTIAYRQVSPQRIWVRLLTFSSLAEAPGASLPFLRNKANGLRALGLQAVGRLARAAGEDAPKGRQPIAKQPSAFCETKPPAKMAGFPRLTCQNGRRSAQPHFIAT